MLDNLGDDWSRPYKIARVFEALGMEVPQRLRRERLGQLLDILARSGIEAAFPDGSPIDRDDSPGIEAKVRLKRTTREPATQRVFGFEVLQRIPVGGMAECFRVRDASGEERFLKRVDLRKAGVSTDALRREQAIYAKLDRASAKHVLRVYEALHDDEHMGLLIELADGGTLVEHVEEVGSLSLEETKRIGLEILAGIVELHSLDIVHRDLKPQNVLRSRGQWKLGDFGISKNLARLITHGRTFQAHGTSGYAAPEQWDGREAHPSADVFSFGKILVFLLTETTDVDSVVATPQWRHLLGQCTERAPERRPSAATLVTHLSAL